MKIVSLTYLKFAVVLAIVDSTNSTWWYLSQLNISRSTNPRIFCDFIPKGDKVQRRMCQKSSQTMLSMVNGVKGAITECQHQFRFSKWNCKVQQDDKSVFGKRIMKGGTRELAFLQAIVTAISTLTVAKDCSSGRLACGCSSSQKEIQEPSVSLPFKWGDCEESFKFALNGVRRFTDGIKARDTTAKTMLHNNRAGRKIFETESLLLCKCHGLSGSCTLKTCWRGLPSIRALGHSLREKYDGAIKIKIDPAGRLVPVDRLQRKPGKLNLVYFEDSPDFCHHNNSSSRAALGEETEDRLCNMASDGEDSCEMLCCGRGWNSISKKVSFRCNCRFFWCCSVECETCQEVRVESRCKKEDSLALLSPEQPLRYLLSKRQIGLHKGFIVS